MSMLNAYRAQAPRVVSDLVKWEAHVGYSVDSAELAANQTVEIGTPLMKDANGRLVPLDPADPNLIVGFARANGATGATPRAAFPYVARLALISEAGVVWPAGFDAAKKAATFLAASNLYMIVARAGL